MPIRVTPEQAGERWVQGLSAATQKIAEGVDRVQVSPGQKAAQAADKWLASVTQARDRFARGAGAVQLGDWQAAVKASVGNVASGAQRKQGKYVAKVTPVFARLASVVATIDGMPSTTYEQRKQRAIYLMDQMHASKQ